MTRRVRITGLGLATALGTGCEFNVDGLQRAVPRYGQLQLEALDPAITVPYLTVEGAWHTARQRFDGLLQSAVEEALGEANTSVTRQRELPLFIGSSCHGIALAEQDYGEQLRHGAEDPLPMPLEGFGDIAAFLRRELGLFGVDFVFNTACTAGANALLSAARMIMHGHCSAALVIGLETFNHTSAAGFNGMQLLSEAVMRPFDRRRSGLVLGEGCAAILLTAQDGDAQPGVYISGGASRCDNYSISASNPDGSAIAEVMQSALSDCGLSRRDIIAVKAHGTASPLNDDGEAAGLKRIFDTLPPLFALKPIVGHTLGACGVVETALVALALRQGFIPATAGFEQYDPELGIAPLGAPMAMRAGHLMLNYFGFGGNNNALILEKIQC